MKLPRLKKALTVLALVVVLLAAAAEAWNWVRAFQGEICIGLGRSERLAVSEAKEGPGLSFLDVKRDFRSETASAIPFESPGTSVKLLGSGRYDAVRLPFSIRLKQAHVLREEQPHNLVKISGDIKSDAAGAGLERSIDLQERGEIEINGEKYQLKTVRKWSGLFRYASGEPLAALSLRRPGEPWTENVFVSANAWRRVEPEIGLRCFWSPSEAAARDALAAGLPGIEAARWGVVEGATVNWFESFLPGAGAELKNGGTVTLLRLDEAGQEPFVEVQFIEGGQRTVERAAANRRDANARVRFEYFPRLETVILLNAFDDDRAVFAAYHKRQSCGQRTLSAGESWSPEGFPFEIRFDQALRTAVPVSVEDSTVYEAVLQGPLKDLRLRQGEAVRCGDVLLEFSRKADPPQVRYDFTASDEDSHFDQAFSLGPGERVRLRDWRFSQGPPAPDPTHAAILDVEHSPVWSPPRIVLAGGLAVLACLVIFTRAEQEAAPARPGSRKTRAKDKLSAEPSSKDSPKPAGKRASKRTAKRPPKV